jgi:hypothetical protein
MTLFTYVLEVRIVAKLLIQTCLARYNKINRIEILLNCFTVAGLGRHFNIHTLLAVKTLCCARSSPLIYRREMKIYISHAIFAAYDYGGDTAISTEALGLSSHASSD